MIRVKGQLVLVVSRLDHIPRSEITRQTLTQTDKVQDETFVHGHRII